MWNASPGMEMEVDKVSDSMKLPIKNVVDNRLDTLYSLWEQLGLEEKAQLARNETIEKHIEELLDRMIEEEVRARKKIMESLKMNTKLAMKLSKELEVPYSMPNADMPLVKLERLVRHEADKLNKIKTDRMEEVDKLRRKDEELCQKLQLDPYYVSSHLVPTSKQMDGLREHIKTLELEKFTRLEQYLKFKETALQFYKELEAEPATEMEREIVCEDADRFVLSSANLSAVEKVVAELERRKKENEKLMLGSVERLELLYEMLQLDMADKFSFLADNQGCGPTVIARVGEEIARLEQVKRDNIGKFVLNLRGELRKLWEACFYSQEQRDTFSQIHSEEFTEQLLEEHEDEVKKLQEYFNRNRELFVKVEQRQTVWKNYMELERRAKDPSRLMNARGNTLLQEEKERNKVNKTLPRLEKELQKLIQAWEQENKTQFLVGGVSFTRFLELQKEEHSAQLEEEKEAREAAKKKTLVTESRFGARPATPVRLRMGMTTPRKGGRQTPAATRSVCPSPSPRPVRATSRIAATRLTRNTRRKSAKGENSLGLNKSSCQIKRKSGVKSKAKLKKAFADQTNLSAISSETSIRTGSGVNLSICSTVPDYLDFKKNTPLNSTVKTRSRTRNCPPSNKESKLFKTPTGPPLRSRGVAPRNNSYSTRWRTGGTVPFLL